MQAEMMGTQLRPELGRNLTFGLLEILGRAIVVGDYHGRSFPTEAELVKQYGVSRSVTREAVKMLNAKGLLGARPKQGTFVQPEAAWNLFDTDVLRWLLERKSSIGLLRQFNELRLAVEPEAAALAAARSSAEHRAAIGRGLERMHQAELGFDEPLDADIAFHVAILEASANPFFGQFRDVVATALRASIRVTNRIAGRTANVAAHADVLTAINANAPAEARIAMTRLIVDVLDLIERNSDGSQAR